MALTSYKISIVKPWYGRSKTDKGVNASFSKRGGMFYQRHWCVQSEVEAINRDEDRR